MYIPNMKTPSFDFLEENPTASTECSNCESASEINLAKNGCVYKDAEPGSLSSDLRTSVEKRNQNSKSQQTGRNAKRESNRDVGRTRRLYKRLFEAYFKKREKIVEGNSNEREYDNFGFGENESSRESEEKRGFEGIEKAIKGDADCELEIEFPEKNSRISKLMALLGYKYTELDSIVFYSSLILMLMLSIFICYADRIVMPSCIKSIGDEFKFDKSEQGVILGVFYGGYIWTQIIGGYIADTTKLGGKGVLFSGVFFWSLCMILTSVLSYLGIIGFVICRVALGIGEGVSFPAVSSIIGRNVPQKYLATVFSIIIASSYMGGGFSAFVTPPMIQKMGWRGPFYVLGSVGIVWSLIWLFFDVKSQKWSRVPRITEINKDRSSNLDDDKGKIREFTRDIELCKTSSFPTKKVEIKRTDQGYSNLEFESPPIVKNNRLSFRVIQKLLLNRNIFAVIVSQYCHGWTQYGFVTWMPIYYTDIHKIETGSMGFYTTPPWVLQSISIILFGYLSDISKYYFKPITVRKLFQSLSMFVGAACQLSLIAINKPGSSSSSPHYTLLVVCLMFIFNAMSCGGVTVYQFDIAPEIPAVVYAIGNTFGTIAGLFSISLTGLILNKSEYDIKRDTGNLLMKDTQSNLVKKWEIVLLIYAIHNIIGGLVFIILGNDKDISFESKNKQIND
ncbi:Na-dependent inorganic phosphate cotransporter [Cryptosporidium ryanae]|uniref:Na-dependent inorganic phosphate cotransporter n=1 Tax=Cryptosporidium ryanae TaxID=515981 RepID=UPI00351A9380|nr:Na-dependent inorganic phosphate cotransporter [Cryptosporidium ryanae]